MIMVKDQHIEQVITFLRGVVQENSNENKSHIAKFLLGHLDAAKQGYPKDKNVRQEGT